MSIIPIPADMVEGSECLAFGVPWVVPEAIFMLDDILRKEDNVLEYGVGGSTIFYANRCDLVFGVDTSLGWLDTVMGKLIENKMFNAMCAYGASEDDICDNILKMQFTDLITVFSVDTQGGINRSKILSSFLNRTHAKLRVIILDNYSHPELFPDHHDKILDLGEDWEVFTYDHERWAGSGTRIYLKKDK